MSDELTATERAQLYAQSPTRLRRPCIIAGITMRDAQRRARDFGIRRDPRDVFVSVSETYFPQLLGRRFEDYDLIGITYDVLDRLLNYPAGYMARRVAREAAATMDRALVASWPRGLALDVLSVLGNSPEEQVLRDLVMDVHGGQP